MTSLSQLSINRTNQSLAWELLIRDAHPQMHLLPGTAQAMGAVIQQQAPQSWSGSLCPVSSLQETGWVTWRDSLWLCVTLLGLQRTAPSIPYRTITRMERSVLTARCTHCHLDLCPTTVMSCDQVEKSKGIFPYRFPSTYNLYPLAIPRHKWLPKT